MHLFRLLIFFGISFSIYANNAYSQIILGGQVRDNVTFVGVPSHQLTIIGDTTYQNTASYSKTIYTDNQGYFSDTLYLISGPAKYYVITLDCSQNPVIDSFLTVFPATVTLDICTGGINMCLSDFIAYYDSADFQLIHFYNLSSSNSTSYFWDFGDGNYAVAQHPDHHYNLGSYNVCLTVTDSISNCSDIYCDSITISPSMNCKTNYTYSLIGQKKYSFVANINNIYPTLYDWDFGDYTYGNGKNIVHQFQQPGNYTVKLTSTSFHPQTLDTCISHYQQVIQVSGSPTAGVWGQVFADSSIVDHGIVYLYSYSQNNSTFNLIDSTIVLSIDSLNISYYLFANLNYGKYATYLKLQPNSIYNQDYGPSYSGNTIYWNNAQIVNLNQPSTNLPINLTHLYKQNGTSSISGHVYQGSKANVGDPIANMPLFLLDNANVIIDFQYSHSDGSYNFHNLNPQKYFIYSDAINHSIYPADAIITLQNQNIHNIDIYVGSSTVTSIKDKNLPKDFKIFPNPTSKELNINFSSPQEQIINYEITDLLGKKVFSSSAKIRAGFNNFKFNIDNLNTGIYLFLIKSTNRTLFRKKLIIN